MKLEEIKVLASKFAQTFDPYDQNLLNNIKNVPPDHNSYSWKTVATILLKYFSSADPNEQDYVITDAVHKIMNINDSNKVPDAAELINAASTALNAIKSKMSDNREAIQIGGFFVNLTNKIVDKYFGAFHHADIKTKSNEVSVDQNGQQQNQLQKKVESLWGFLTRTYQTLRSGKQLTPEDMAQFNANKSFYTRRLNGLNSLQTRTPDQENEKNILQAVLKKVV
jgi:hypothetical protein